MSDNEHYKRSSDILDLIEDSLSDDCDKADLLSELDDYFSLNEDPNRDRETQVISVNKESRVETGPVKFVYEDGSEDWTGVFIRGDGAMYYHMMLDLFLDEKCDTDPMTRFQVKSLKNLLVSSNEL